MAADVLIPLLLVMIIVAAISLMYLIPLDLSLILERQTTVTTLYASATWCIFSLGVNYRNGTGCINLLLGGKTVWTRSIKPPVRAGKPPEPWDYRIAADLFREILILKPGVFRIIRAFFRHTRIRKLACDIRFGLSRPAVTGMIFGCYTAIRPLVMQDGRVSLSASPVFDRELLEGSCRCDLRVDRPLVVPALVIRLFLNPRSWHLVSFARPDRRGAGA
jgi:hypothetical protein